MIKNAQNKMKKENPPNYLFTTWQEKGHFGMCSYSVGAPTLKQNQSFVVVFTDATGWDGVKKN